MLPGAAAVAVSHDGVNVYAGGTNELRVFARDPASGALTFVESHVDGVAGVDGLAGLHDIAVTADGAHVYATGSDQGTIAIFSRTLPGGELTFTGVVRDGVGGVNDLAGASALAISPDDAHVYVPAAIDDALVVFERNASTGALTLVEAQRDGEGGVTGLNYVRAVTVSADGADVYTISGATPPPVDHFRRDAATGHLTFEGVRIPLSYGFISDRAGIAVTPDGSQVIGVATAFNGEGVFQRRADGSLGEDLESTSGLGGGAAVVADPRGTALYTAPGFARRDPRSGEIAGITSIPFASQGVALSPDARHLYATGSDQLVAYRIQCIPLTQRGRLQLSIGGDSTLGDDSLGVKGEGILDASTFASLDPIATGMRVRIATPTGGAYVDGQLPAGAFAGRGTAGWKLNGAGNTWIFADKTTAPVAGIVKLKVQDRSNRAPGQIKVSVKGRNWTYFPPVTPVLAPPPIVYLDLAPGGTCVATAYHGLLGGSGDCRERAGGTKFSCAL